MDKDPWRQICINQKCQRCLYYLIKRYKTGEKKYISNFKQECYFSYTSKKGFPKVSQAEFFFFFSSSSEKYYWHIPIHKDSVVMCNISSQSPSIFSTLTFDGSNQYLQLSIYLSCKKESMMSNNFPSL